MNTTRFELARALRRPVNRLGTLLALALICTGASAATPPPRTVDRLQTEARGIYLLWGQGRPDAEALLELPFVRGGQIMVQWAEVAPAPGRYDFSAVDRALANLAGRGRWTTLQVNGNRKPGWLFERVPHVKQSLSTQVSDPAGTLMFWHPVFQDAHLGMLAALAEHLRASPHRAKLLGLRLNFNAVGTEHFSLPPEYRSPDRWLLPPGMARAGLTPFTPAEHEAYADKVVSAYERLFADWATVFVRNNLSDELRTRYEHHFRSGRLAWFHTSSEAEPRSSGTERQYSAFLDYCRSGQTVGYAEPWASAWGEHGGQTDPRWCSPAQWIYWTLLLNLHCGVSFIGEYYTNLHYAYSGRHGRDPVADPSQGAPREFMAAYEWASRYIGRHNHPAESPGAWVAFRANAVVKADNAKVAPAARKLTRFTGDYTWLAERVDGDDSEGVGSVGPAGQRYGAFARRYPAGGVARVRLDPQFVDTLTGSVTVRVITLGDHAAQLRIGDRAFAVPPSGGTWGVTEFSVPAAQLQKQETLLEVRAGSGPLLLHLVEVERGQPVQPPAR